jgi:hypothetical protein
MATDDIAESELEILSRYAFWQYNLTDSKEKKLELYRRDFAESCDCAHGGPC